MKIQTQLKAGGPGINHNQTQIRTVEGQAWNHNQTQVRTVEGKSLNHNQTEVRTVEKLGTCPPDAGAAGGVAVVSSDAEAGGAGIGNQAEPQPDPGTPEGFGVIRKLKQVRARGMSWNHNQTLVRKAS